MASKVDHHTVKVIEQCQISPPPGSVPSTIVPLCFFDLIWFHRHPVQRILFYEFPYSTDHFCQTVLPTLRHSLSLTLQHYFPCAANLVYPPKPHIPHFLYSDGDSVSFIVAESSADFTYLVSDSPRDIGDFHPFVPVLPSPRILEDGTQLFSPMAIQVTVMPNSGFSISVTLRHELTDGNGYSHFIKFWASVCKSRGGLTSLEGSLPLPLHNRDKIEDPKGLKPIFLEALWNSYMESKESLGLVRVFPSDRVRRRFVLSHDHVKKLKKWVSIKCENFSLKTSHLSTFVVTCSLIWVCKVKSEETKVDTVPNNDELYVLNFPADCRYRPEFSIPSTYFGNCLVQRHLGLKRSTLVGENGILEAVMAIGSQVKDLQCDALKGAERLKSSGRGLANWGQRFLTIAGSPKLGLYETDFGWGKPEISEVIHLDKSGSISLSDCRDKEGAVEVGLVLERTQMNTFSAILEDHLRDFAMCD